MITGEVVGEGVIELIKYCAKKGMTGILFFKSNSMHGEVHLARWAVVGAKTQDNQGDKALEQIVRMDKADYSFEESSQLLANVTISIESLYEASKNTPSNIGLRSFDIFKPSTDNISNETLDSDLQRAMFFIKNGVFYCQFQIALCKRIHEVNEIISNLLEKGYINVLTPKIVSNVFLFPKNATMMLTENEKWLFNQIYEGMGLTELIEKTLQSPQELCDKLTWLYIKRVLTMSDCTGKVLEPSVVRADMQMVGQGQYSRLFVRMDKSLGNRTQTARVDRQQMAFWNQVLIKSNIPAISIKTTDGDRIFAVEVAKNIQGYILLSQADMISLRKEEMDDIDCCPVANPF
jgi:hypothetical protein